MAQEFVIKSTTIEDKINELLPSQGGFEPGVDFSASTMVVPIVDLTESAEGGQARADLQTALSFATATAFSVVNTTTTVVNTTGYWRVFGCLSYRSGATPTVLGEIILNDGTTDKTVWAYQQSSTGTISGADNAQFDVIIFLPAGHSLKISSSQNLLFINGSVRQVADISGNLINP